LAFRPALGNLPGHQDRAGTGAPERHTAKRPLADRIEQAVEHQQFANRRAFTPWYDQTIDLFKMFREPHLLRRSADSS
jgi:hypothetical protein